MSDPNSPRRPKAAAAKQRPARFEARQEPVPPPRLMAKEIDLVESFPDMRPRTQRSASHAPNTRQTQPRISSGRNVIGPLSEVRSPLAETSADLDRARLLGSRPAPLPRVVSTAAPGRTLLALIISNPLLVLLLGGVFLLIFLKLSAPPKVVISGYRAGSSAPARVSTGGGLLETLWGFVASPTNQQGPSAPPGEHSILGPPTISAQDVEAVLRQYNSPAAGTGRAWIELGKQYGIDPAYALAFFVHESTAGTNPGWAGLKPGGSSTHNVGNIICAGYSTCYGRFRDYKTWDEGIEDWYKLIANEYVRGRGVQTVEQIIPIYAPAFENDVDAYVNTVVGMVDGWHRNGAGQ
jgi:hypothetical protein